jgi:diacylglycerol kinase family enzyme
MQLTGGDLFRTLGGPSPGRDVSFPVDLGEVLVDGRLHLFVAHLVVRGRLWSGFSLAAMNAQWLGAWNLGPKAHPNDGLLDVSEGSLRAGDLWKVRARLHHGAHLPHPRIAHRRVAAVQVDLPRPMAVRLDGVVAVKAARRLSIRVEPDALTVVV